MKARPNPKDSQANFFYPDLIDQLNPKDEFALARWLDKNCQQSDINQADMLELCRMAVASFLAAGNNLELLFQGKKIISQLVKQKIANLRLKAKKTAFQDLLGGRQKARLEFDQFAFPTANYAENISRYQGAYQFKKHYLGIPRDLKAKGEEFRCAQAIDMCPQVEIWLRNVDRQKGSFFLPTSTDNFYPDFVARLTDGRILLVEYKGAHLLESEDTREKVNIGKFWAEKSEGKGCFMLACEAVDEYKFDRQMKQVLI